MGCLVSIGVAVNRFLFEAVAAAFGILGENGVVFSRTKFGVVEVQQDTPHVATNGVPPYREGVILRLYLNAGGQLSILNPAELGVPETWGGR